MQINKIDNYKPNQYKNAKKQNINFQRLPNNFSGVIQITNRQNIVSRIASNKLTKLMKFVPKFFHKKPTEPPQKPPLEKSPLEQMKDIRKFTRKEKAIPDSTLNKLLEENPDLDIDNFFNMLSVHNCEDKELNELLLAIPKNEYNNVAKITIGLEKLSSDNIQFLIENINQFVELQKSSEASINSFLNLNQKQLDKIIQLSAENDKTAYAMSNYNILKYIDLPEEQLQKIINISTDKNYFDNISEIQDTHYSEKRNCFDLIGNNIVEIDLETGEINFSRKMEKEPDGSIRLNWETKDGISKTDYLLKKNQIDANTEEIIIPSGENIIHNQKATCNKKVTIYTNPKTGLKTTTILTVFENLENDQNIMIQELQKDIMDFLKLEEEYEESYGKSEIDYTTTQETSKNMQRLFDTFEEYDNPTIKIVQKNINELFDNLAQDNNLSNSKIKSLQNRIQKNFFQKYEKNYGLTIETKIEEKQPNEKIQTKLIYKTDSQGNKIPNSEINISYHSITDKIEESINQDGPIKTFFKSLIGLPANTRLRKFDTITIYNEENNPILQTSVFDDEVLREIKALPPEWQYHILNNIPTHRIDITDDEYQVRVYSKDLTLLKNAPEINIHEAMHVLDKNDSLSHNGSLSLIANKEKAILPIIFAKDINYFLKNYNIGDVININKPKKISRTPRAIFSPYISEIAAESNVITNSVYPISNRTLYLQRYFPETCAKITELLYYGEKITNDDATDDNTTNQ